MPVCWCIKYVNTCPWLFSVAKNTGSKSRMSKYVTAYCCGYKLHDFGHFSIGWRGPTPGDRYTGWRRSVPGTHGTEWRVPVCLAFDLSHPLCLGEPERNGPVPVTVGSGSNRWFQPADIAGYNARFDPVFFGLIDSGTGPRCPNRLQQKYTFHCHV